jgi:hypothetical protein
MACFLMVGASAVAAEPTESRTWSSTAGTSLEAKAKAVDGGVVVFETKDGRVVKVPLDKLVAADREALVEHFGVEDKPTTAEPPKGDATLAHPLGKTVGPITANGSTYFVYLPTTLKAGRTYPLLLYTGATGGVEGTLNPLKEGAEICGWVVACSVESRNGQDNEVAHKHAKNAVDHLKQTLPIDAKRIYYAGNSGGARMAFFNSLKLKGAGVIAQIAGAKDEEIERGKPYYFISGAHDYNRAGTAHSYSLAKRSSAFRFHKEGHTEAPPWMLTEAIVWMEAQWQKQAKSDPTRADFEVAVAHWIAKLVSEDENRAAWWIAHLTNTGFRPKLPVLKPSEAHTAYINGIAALENFAAGTIAEGPRYSPACFNHTSPEIDKKADAMLETFGSNEWLKSVLESLKKPTDQG